MNRADPAGMSPGDGCLERIKDPQQDATPWLLAPRFFGSEVISNSVTGQILNTPSAPYAMTPWSPLGWSTLRCDSPMSPASLVTAG
jgi:hypothetical protein